LLNIWICTTRSKTREIACPHGSLAEYLTSRIHSILVAEGGIGTLQYCVCWDTSQLVIVGQASIIGRIDTNHAAEIVARIKTPFRSPVIRSTVEEKKNFLFE